jgi:hypothetical protein
VNEVNRAHQRSAAERANESARCVQNEESASCVKKSACAAERSEANKYIRRIARLKADGWYLRSDIIWTKPNPDGACRQRRQAER